MYNRRFKRISWKLIAQLAILLMTAAFIAGESLVMISVIVQTQQDIGWRLTILTCSFGALTGTLMIYGLWKSKRFP